MSIIRVDNLGKCYTIGHDRRAGGMFKYSSLRDTLAHQARGLWQRARHPLSPNRENTDLEEFWALRDVSFEIQPGERVGIIGRNGAGKSTLLKLLSRITEPTTGRIELNGRVASLLEVGTGFHPELTGRENIHLNGAILGMQRAEIRKKFDEIVAFAEVEKFLDTPVKRYSSGMYVRLAFAVAAHLEPEILLVDEVLAVGDAAFQKKCLGKMEDVATNEGRTVLFVSHNMESVRRLCGTAMQVAGGEIHAIGSVDKILDNYLLESLDVAKERDLKHEITRSGHGGVKATSFRVEGSLADGHLASGGPCRFVVGYRADGKRTKIARLFGAIGIKDAAGGNLFVCSTRMFGTDFFSVAPEGELSCQLDALPLLPGQYVVTIKLMDEGGLADQLADAATIHVSLDSRSALREIPRSAWGSICVRNTWFVEGESHR